MWKMSKCSQGAKEHGITQLLVWCGIGTGRVLHLMPLAMFASYLTASSYRLPIGASSPALVQSVGSLVAEGYRAAIKDIAFVPASPLTLLGRARCAWDGAENQLTRARPQSH